MKKVLKVNLVAVLALFLSVGMMSFKMVSKNNVVAGWYAVDASGNLSPSTIPVPDGTDCSTLIQEDICAVEWQSSAPRPNTYAEVLAAFPDAPRAGRVE